jgi:hypothetical protein
MYYAVILCWEVAPQTSSLLRSFWIKEIRFKLKDVWTEVSEKETML